MFAPIMTRMDWANVSAPALTKLTTLTVAALEDWAIAVIPNPDRMLLNGFLRIQGKKRLSLSPEALSKLLLMRLSP